MGLVEGVGSEFLPVRPDFLEDGLVVAVRDAAVDELRLEGVQLLLDLLAHRLAQRVALAAGEARQLARQEHHLLLVDRDAVGVLEVLLHHRDVVLDGLAAVLAVDEVRDVVHRARAVEGVHRYDVLELAGLEFAQIAAHAVALELEDGCRVAVAEELVGRLVVEGDFLHVDALAAALLDVLHALLLDGEGGQAQEVHLQHAHVFDERALVLAHQHVLAGLLVFHHAQRDVVGEVGAADDGGAGVHSGLADAALQLRCEVDGLLHQVVRRFVGRLEFRVVLYAVRQGDGEGLLYRLLLVVRVRHVGFEGPCRDDLGQTVAHRQRHLVYTGHVLDGALGGHGAEGGHVRNVVLAVFVLDVAVDVAAAVVVEVNVDIGHRDAVGVEETLEQQVVFQGVDVGDVQAVGHHASGCAASARTDPGAFAARRLDEVLHYEEVVREAHVGDGLQLELDTVGLLLA